MAYILSSKNIGFQILHEGEVSDSNIKLYSEFSLMLP